MNRPDTNEYAPYYERYISKVTEDEIVPVLSAQSAALQDMFAGIRDEKGTFAYGEGKWTIKEVLSHLIDAERMFAYRALRISRGDETPIEGFEQDGYIENSHANDRSITGLLDEFNLLRSANLLLFKNLDDIGWKRIGTASDNRVSVRALAFIMAGHVVHHAAILQERYLS